MALESHQWQWTNDQPNTSAWVERIGRLEGEYGRPAGIGCLALVMMLFWALFTGVMVLFLVYAMGKVQHLPFMGIFLGAFVLVLVIWIGTIWRRVGLKYVLRDGTLSALGTYRNIMWTESLQGLREIRYSRLRGAVHLTLVWPDRQREMLGIPSLLNALEEREGSRP